MKICICCSLKFGNEVREIEQQLQRLGHEVLLPNGIINHLPEQPDYDPVQAKIDTDSNHQHVDKIRVSDAILVCNYDKNGIRNYIGANTFAEMFIAYYFNKPIFCLHDLPNQSYINDELQSFRPIILHNDLTKLRL